LKGPGTKCLVPTTSEILYLSTGIECKTVDPVPTTTSSENETNELVHDKIKVSYGSYSMRQYVNPKLTDCPLEITLYRPFDGQIAQIEVHVSHNNASTSYFK
jgi:hypothetical protein